jgi:hypothetical protein
MKNFKNDFKKIFILIMILGLPSCDVAEDRSIKNAIIIPAGYECEKHPQRWDGAKYYDDYCMSYDYLYKYVCDKEQRAKFIVECARAANPMSDEEGEDLVAQCDKTSQRIFCSRKYYKND